eukprot:6191158-Pleurochrysis_carterae.AAC.1
MKRAIVEPSDGREQAQPRTRTGAHAIGHSRTQIASRCMQLGFARRRASSRGTHRSTMYTFAKDMTAQSPACSGSRDAHVRRAVVPSIASIVTHNNAGKLTIRYPVGR